MSVTKQLIFFLAMEANGVHQLFDCQHYSKYLPLCSAEDRNSQRFEKKLRNADRILIFK